MPPAQDWPCMHMYTSMHAYTSQVRKAWAFRFDWWFRTRTAQELGSRVELLSRLVEKEVATMLTMRLYSL